MKACSFSGCHHEATLTARLFRVGDRAWCREHFDWMVAQGMDIRELGTDVALPEWRTRSLARDMTRVVA